MKRKRSRAQFFRQLRFEQLETRRLLAVGDLDPTFGVNGTVVTAFTNPALLGSQANAMVVQVDGKVVVAGSYNDSHHNFALLRYNTDGTLDNSFGDGGRVQTVVSAQSNRINALVIQTDGKIVAGGYSSPNGPNNFTLVRYNANGSLDTSFGISGISVTSLTTSDDAISSLALQADGKIVAAGTILLSNNDFAVARYHTDGTLDQSFGVGGFTTISFSAPLTQESAKSVVVQADGKIVVGGISATQSSAASDFALARLNSDGTLDTSFGGTGQILTPVGPSSDDLYSLTLQADGKIVAAGGVRNAVGSGIYNFGLVRYNTDGTLDTSFNGTGKLTTFGLGTIYAVAIGGDGKITTAGKSSTSVIFARYLSNGALDTSFNGSGQVSFQRTDLSWVAGLGLSGGQIVAAGWGSTSMSVARLNDNGTLDTTFAGTGVAVGTFSTQEVTTATPRALARQADGKFLVVGDVYNDTDYDFSLVRYNSDGSLDTSFGVAGIVRLDLVAGANDKGYDVAVQADGKILVAGTVTNLAGGNFDFGLVRLNTDGSLDTTFGSGGLVTTVFDTGDDVAQSVVVQSDGKIVVGGYALIAGNTRAAIARYNANGTLDTSFNSTGRLTFSFNTTTSRIARLEIQADGKLLAAGYHSGSTRDFAVARINSNGTFDTSFNSTGKQTIDIASSLDEVTGLIVQPNGKVVLVGTYSIGTSSNGFGAVRLLPNGKLDGSFGTGGIVSSTTVDGVYDAALQADGRIVMATYDVTSGSRQIVRLNVNGTIDSTFTSDRWNDAVPQGILVQPDGQIVVAAVINDSAFNNMFAIGRYVSSATTTQVAVLEDAANSVLDLTPEFAGSFAPGANLTYSIFSNTNAALFAAVSIDQVAASLTLDYAANANGIANVVVQATDGTTTVQVPYSVSVTSVNDVPSFTPGGNRTVNEDSASVTNSTWATTLSRGPADEASQTLGFSVSQTNAALFTFFNIDNQGRLSYTLAANVSGSSVVTVRLTDNGGTDYSGVDISAPVNFTFTVNPVNDVPSFIKGVNQSVNEDGGAQTVAGWATVISKGPLDEAGQTLDFLVTNNNNSLFSVQPTIAANGTLTYTPASNAVGSATVSVSLRDNGGTANGGVDTSAVQTFTITVNGVNDSPSFTKGADQTINEDAGLQTIVGWATNISVGPANESAQTLAFQVTNDNNALFAIQPTIDSAGTLTYSVAANAYGAATVSVRLADNGGTGSGGVDTSAAQTFTINVNSVNDPPSFTKGANLTIEAFSGSQTVSAWATNISAGPADEASQSVVFQVSNDNNSLFAIQPTIDATGNLSYTPAPNSYGTATVAVVAVDNGSAANGGINSSAAQTFTITLGASKLIGDTGRRDEVHDPLRNVLYISTGSGQIQRYDLATHAMLTPWSVGNSLNGMDITADGSALYVAESQTFGSLGFIHKVNLADGTVTTITFSLVSGEAGAWDVKIGALGLALVTTQFAGSGWTPLRQLNTSTDVLTIRSDAPGSGSGGKVRQNTTISRSADRSELFLAEANISSGPAFTYNALTNTFPSTIATGASLSSALPSVNRDGSLIALPLQGVTIYDRNLLAVKSLPTVYGGSAFDPVRNLLYVANNNTNEIVAYDTSNNYFEVLRMPIGESLGASIGPLGSGMMRLSSDGEYLFLNTPAGIRVFSLVGLIVEFPPPQLIQRNSSLALSSESNNLVALLDFNSSASNVEVMLTATNGILTLASVAGLTSVAGNGTSSIAMTGNVANLNAALDGLVFMPSNNFTGVATIQLAAIDPDGRAPGYSLTNANSFQVGVSVAGQLDPTFGAGGKLMTSLSAADDVANAVAIQADGKILLGGYQSNGFGVNFSLVRYLVDGSLDGSFGAGGKVSIQMEGAGADYSSIINGLLVQPDGKIVATGTAWNSSAPQFATARFNANGTLDATFGTGGRFKYSADANNTAYAVALQLDGKLVVVGTGYPDGMLVERYTANGALDATFGVGGVVKLSLTSSAPYRDEAHTVAIQTDGKIVIAGYNSFGDSRFLLARLNADGSLDETFGTSGKVLTSMGSENSYARSLVIQSDGKIVVAGSVTNASNSDIGLVRYNSNGTLDTNFGVGGKVVVPVGTGNDSGRSLAIQPDGKLLVSGSFSDGGNSGLAMIRLTPDGSLDSTFGLAGKVTTLIGLGSGRVNALAIQPDGRYVVAGIANDGTRNTFAAARYLRDPPSLVGNSAIGMTQNGPTSTIDLFSAIADSNDASSSLVYTVVGNTNPDLVVPTLDAGTGQLTLSYVSQFSDFEASSFGGEGSAGFSSVGSSDVTIRATNSAGLSTDVTFKVTVSPPARVNAVYANGSAWVGAYRSVLAAAGVGDASLGYKLADGAGQLSNANLVSWTNVDQLIVVFNSEVHVEQSHLTLYNSVGNIVSSTGFSKNAATNTATWNFPNLAAGKYWLSISSMATKDANNAALDGDWITGTSTFANSGDGTPGGDFNFRFNVLPGDANTSGVNSSGDVGVTRTRAGQPVGVTNYRQDVNGSNTISSGDVGLVRTRAGAKLDDYSEPTLPSGSLPSGSPLTVDARPPVWDEPEEMIPAVSVADDQLAPLVQEALARWTAALGSAAVASLSDVRFEVTDLGYPGYLSLALPGLIRIDNDAAGLGWFIDDSPSEDGEFSEIVADTEKLAVDGPAVGRVDLLTVVMHELGHQLGRDDLDPVASPHQLMDGVISTGMRRLPEAAASEDVAVSLVADEAIVGEATLDAHRFSAMEPGPVPVEYLTSAPLVVSAARVAPTPLSIRAADAFFTDLGATRSPSHGIDHSAVGLLLAIGDSFASGSAAGDVAAHLSSALPLAREESRTHLFSESPFASDSALQSWPEAIQTAVVQKAMADLPDANDRVGQSASHLFQKGTPNSGVLHKQLPATFGTST